MSAEPLILFIPGLRPKPPAEEHRAQMLRCLIKGLRRVAPDIAGDFDSRSSAFQLVAWNYPFYHQYHDISDDMPGIEAVLIKEEADPRDRSEAKSWKRAIIRFIYRIADFLPFLIPQLASGKIELHLRDFRRYVSNRGGDAEAARGLLKTPLVDALRAGRPVMIVGHSMGSVIAYDVLWQLSHQSYDSYRLDTLLTLGTPLGQNLIQHRLKGSQEEGVGRYPTNIGDWVNISAAGDLTAIDVKISNDFAAMSELEVIDTIIDLPAFNWFRDGGDGALNVHSEYGYLINPVTAGIVADWWRRNAMQDPDSA